MTETLHFAIARSVGDHIPVSDLLLMGQAATAVDRRFSFTPVRDKYWIDCSREMALRLLECMRERLADVATPPDIASECEADIVRLLAMITPPADGRD